MNGTRRHKTAAIALAAALLAAPTASARLDEGTSPSTAAPAAARIADEGGFSWDDAGIGAGAALGAVVLAVGAGLAVRKRTQPAHW